MRPVIVLMVLQASVAQESAQYLESVISNLKGSVNVKHHVKNNVRRSDHHETIPPTGTTVPSLALTKGELTALYEAALNKGQAVTLNNAHGTNLQALVHEIDQSPQSSSNAYHGDSPLDSDTDGYYYYYYPLKSFMDGFSQGHVRNYRNLLIAFLRRKHF